MSLTEEYLQQLQAEFSSRSSPPVSLLERLLNAFPELSNNNKASSLEKSNNLWFDALQLMKDLLKAIPVEELLIKQQVISLSVINKAPDDVIQWMVSHQLMAMIVGKEKERYGREALAVIVALTRRLPRPCGSTAICSLIRHFLYLPEVRTELESQLHTYTISNTQNYKSHSEIRFRLYQVAISALELDSFNNSQNNDDYSTVQPLIDALLAELFESGDLLAEITALEMLSSAAASKKATAEYFGRMGLLEQVYEMLEKSKVDPDGGLLHAATIRFFGNLSIVDADALEKFPHFTEEVFSMVNHFDALDAPRRQLAFDTLSIMSTTKGAKAFLSSSKSPYDMAKAMNHFGVAIAMGTEDLRIRHLNALQVMMMGSGDGDEQEVLKVWFHELGEPFPQMITSFLKTPLERVKVACLQLLITLFSNHHHKWAVPLFFVKPAFLEYLLERRDMISVEEAQLKFDVICSILVGAADGGDGLNESQLKALRLYQKQGVFYSPARVEVASENQ